MILDIVGDGALFVTCLLQDLVYFMFRLRYLVVQVFHADLK